MRWDDGNGRITVIHSKTDVEAEDTVVAVTPAAVRALDVVRSVGIGGGQKGVRAVEVADLPAGEGNRQSSRPFRLGVLQRPQRARGHGPPDAQNGAPTLEIERQGRWKQGGGMVGRYTRGEAAGSALRYL